MGAATRESTAAAVDALAAIQRPSAELGGQLLAAARAVASSRQLVTVLADPGIPGEQRSALARKALGPVLGPQSATVVGVLAAGRWSEPDDLVGAVEETGFRALAGQGSAEGLEAELFTVSRAVRSDGGGVELALGDHAAPIAARLALVDSLLGDATDATRTIVRHVVQLPRGRKPVEAIDRAQSIVAAARDRLVAVVQTARPLTDAQQETLAERLASQYGRKIALNQVLEPTLLGGLRITVGDDVIDGTVRARLDDLRLRLAG